MRLDAWITDWSPETTASEPLSVEEEFEMQASWRDDDDKCTFIVMDNTLNENEIESGDLECMAGDVNLFFNDTQGAEIEVMIAEENSRRKGLAREALILLMSYGAQRLKTHTYVAKIGAANLASLALFQALGYEEQSFCDVFKEHTLTCPAEKYNQPLTIKPDTVSTEGLELLDAYVSFWYGPEESHIKQSLDFISELVPACSASILEIGCNVGSMAFQLAQKYKSVHGIDDSYEFIAKAKSVRDEAYRSNLEFSSGIEKSLENLKGKRFNLIYIKATCFPTLQDLDNLLEPDGIVVIQSCPFAPATFPEKLAHDVILDRDIPAIIPTGREREFLYNITRAVAIRFKTT
mmetsp:Transcript_7585/g.12250  ORF Transcript_7585/g.12250 Transcript_7585/m.12250 type:complete len:349 (-) Transcript_7585:753-1799(-)